MLPDKNEKPQEGLMGQPRIVVLEGGSLPAPIVLRRPDLAHDWVEHESSHECDLPERLAGAQVAVVNKVPMRRATLDRLPDLRMIAVSATGTDCVDLETCRARGITVSNVRGYAAHTVPEHTMALILALRRSLIGFVDDVRAGQWQKASQFCLFTHPVRDLHGSNIGIVGAGTIGRSVARMAEAFGMRVMFAGRKGDPSPGADRTPFDEMLATADVITLHCPLTADTRDLIAMPEFRAMRRRPVLVNTARGGLVNEADLIRALDEGLIAGAGFDVASPEPPPPDYPLLGLVDRPNFILTPHVAWASQEAAQIVADQTTANIEAFLRGHPVNDVTGVAAGA